MRTSQSFLVFATFLLCLSTFASAWPWPKFLPDIESLIVRRQQDNTTNNDDDNKSSSVTSTSSNTAKSTGKSSATKTSAIHKTSYDARLPAGGVSLISPAATSGAQYYKVGDNVTFAWNFTSLSSTPTALNILASCTANHELYTMAMNQTINGNATAAVTWDTAMYSTAAVQLLTETYTLIIYDADSSISAVPQAGYLAPYAQYTFGMYIPQAYTPLAEGFQCVTCSGALSDMEKRALGFMFGMSLITVLSFSWFMGGLNVIW